MYWWLHRLIGSLGLKGPNYSIKNSPWESGFKDFCVALSNHLLRLAIMFASRVKVRTYLGPLGICAIWKYMARSITNLGEFQVGKTALSCKNLNEKCGSQFAIRTAYFCEVALPCIVCLSKCLFRCKFQRKSWFKYPFSNLKEILSTV